MTSYPGDLKRNLLNDGKCLVISVKMWSTVTSGTSATALRKHFNLYCLPSSSRTSCARSSATCTSKAACTVERLNDCRLSTLTGLNSREVLAAITRLCIDRVQAKIVGSGEKCRLRRKVQVQARSAGSQHCPVHYQVSCDILLSQKLPNWRQHMAVKSSCRY
jgi:hypothetical protein